jgi:formylmethanofuran--tetrahydromethanopterin N-formyltransferase
MTQLIHGVDIEDTFAEAFSMWGARILITAVSPKWAREAAVQMKGFATSIIACGCEAGIEAELTETPDGRPGVSAGGAIGESHRSVCVDLRNNSLF